MLERPRSEEYVLATLLQYPTEIVGRLGDPPPSSDIFTDIASRTLYTVLTGIAATGPFDNKGIIERIEQTDDSEATLLLVATLMDDAVIYDPWSFKHYLQEIRELARRREAILACLKVAYDLPKDNVPFKSTLMELSQLLISLATTNGTQQRAQLVDAIHDAMEEIDLMASLGTNIIGVETGIADLDALTHGFQKGQLIVIAARPGVGKTALSLHTARYCCRHEGFVYFASLEMPKHQLVKRLVQAECGVNPWNLSSGDPEQYKGWMDGAGRIREWVLELDDYAYTVTHIQSRIMECMAKRERTPDLVVVDYLQLMTGPKSERRDLEVANMTKAFKRMAVEMNLPIMVLSQLSRASMAEGKVRRPRLSDLRDSGAIEQDADVVIMLHPTGENGGHAVDGKMELLVEKNRNGETGIVHVEFQRDLQRFKEWREYGPT